MKQECARFAAHIDSDMAIDSSSTLAAHAHTCPDCRAVAAADQRRARLMTALPRSLKPERDLWPEVASRLGATRFRNHTLARAEPAKPARAVRASGFVAGLAAAATIVLLFGSSLFIAPLPRADDQNANTERSHLRIEFAAAEDEYRRALEQLTRVLDQNESLLPSTTQTVIRNNLSIIDQAIADTRAELARDPVERRYAGLLGDMYLHKVELLRRANKIASQ